MVRPSQQSKFLAVSTAIDSHSVPRQASATPRSRLSEKVVLAGLFVAAVALSTFLFAGITQYAI